MSRFVPSVRVTGALVLVATLLMSEPWSLASETEPGKDLRLTYHSEIDNTDQPYRIYIPGRYDGRTPLPLVIALHGTRGNETTFMDAEQYGSGEIQRVAEKYGVLLVCPYGRGVNEYRGIGETDIFRVMEDVQKRYAVDPDRIYLIGHSMGGTGAAYLALHHPDVFAAVAPLAAAHSFPWLAPNARHGPFWWISGSEDSPYFLSSVRRGAGRMIELGYRARSTILPGRKHGDWITEYFDAIFAWLVKHRRQAHPREYVFYVDTPLHGAAYWSAVDSIGRPGEMAIVRARAESADTARFDLTNVAKLAFLPDPEVFDLSRPIAISIDGRPVFTGLLARDEEVLFTKSSGAWTAMKTSRRRVSLTDFRNHPVAVAPEPLPMSGTEAPLANWIADAMRHATGAEVALYNRQYYRGIPIEQGTVDVVDLIQCSRPFDQYLVRARFRGREILEILDDNVPDPKKDRSYFADRPEADRLIQLSGASYSFDPTHPPGKRIVQSSLEPDRIYTVVMEGQVVERETILLAGRYNRSERHATFDYQMTDIPLTLALYGYAANRGEMEVAVEGRVRRVAPLEAAWVDVVINPRTPSYEGRGLRPHSWQVPRTSAFGLLQQKLGGAGRSHRGRAEGDSGD